MSVLTSRRFSHCGSKYASVYAWCLIGVPDLSVMVYGQGQELIRSYTQANVHYGV
jgi:hypothetical protein